MDPKNTTTKCTDDIHCFVYDGFCMLRHIDISKPGIKTGKDLAKAVSDWIISRSGTSKKIIVAFDSYYNEKSLKSRTRSSRYKKGQHYNIKLTTNISSKTWNQLLSHSKTKSSLVDLFMDQIFSDLIIQDVEFVVAGNNKTYSNYMKCNNNHEEADTLIMHCLKLVELGPSENVYVYGYRYHLSANIFLQ